MTSADVKLASDFEAATREHWLGLVDKVLKGGDFEKKLVSKTADGLRVDPIYTRADALPAADANLPGSAPFTRGAHTSVQGLGWEIRQEIEASTPAEANTEIMTELHSGTNGIRLVIEAPGQAGCRITNASEMADALRGMRIDMAPIELVAGLSGSTAARSLIEALPTLAHPAGKAAGSLGLDPIGTLARFGTLSTSLEDEIKTALGFAATLSKTDPALRAIKIDASVYHEAGATEGYELAALASTLVAYLRAGEAAGISAEVLLGQIGFVISVDTEPFTSVAKLRAARKLIWRIADAVGAGAAATKLHITAVTSRRVMAKRDAWTNMLRSTLMCAGATLGGADAITVLPFTLALGRPDAFGRRAARNIQIVLQEESNLGRVLDPMGGSWYIEKLTADLAASAWTLFQEIESQGGIVAGLEAGSVQEKIAAQADARIKAMATGRQELTGVSAFPQLGDDGVKFAPFASVPAIATAAKVKALTPVRFAASYEDLRDKADAHTTKTGKAPTVFLASIGAVIDHTLRSTWIKNYLAAGGIASLTSDGYSNADAAASAFKTSGTEAVCICSSDALYAEHAEATAKALKAAGAKLVLMAGKPGETEAALKAAGVDQFLFAGADAVATLSALQSKLGVGG